MRKEVTSATLGLEEIAVLGVITKREHAGNRSAALRAIIAEAGERRGVAVGPMTSAAKRDVQHEQQAALKGGAS